MRVLMVVQTRSISLRNQESREKLKLRSRQDLKPNSRSKQMGQVKPLAMETITLMTISSLRRRRLQTIALTLMKPLPTQRRHLIFKVTEMCSPKCMVKITKIWITQTNF
jgi:hypothetical protein